MNPALVLHIAICFLIGGIFVATCSTAAERFGPKVGGLIAGLPSTVIASLLFFALITSPEEASREAASVPIALGLNCILLGIFGVAARLGAAPALALSISAWILLAHFVIEAVPAGWGPSLLVQVAGLTIGLFLIRGIQAPEGFTPVPVTLSRAALRALIGGSVIAIGILIGHLDSVRVAGVAAAFPAAGVSTIGIISWARGAAFATGMLHATMISSCTTILTYAAIAHWLFPVWGPVWGSLASLSASLIACRILFRIRHPRKSANS